MLAKLLIEMGANPMSENDNWITPLHLAVYRESFDVVILLLKEGADLLAESRDGERPMDYVHSEEMMSIIQEYGKNTDI